jgi:arylsulfatase A-like enzyme
MGGHPQAETPNLDRLAERGTLFTNAHCQAPVCTPSRASLVTGLSPSTTGLYFLRPFIRDSEVARDKTTLAEAFAETGYETLGVGKVYGGGDRRYFQEYGGRFGGFGPRPDEKISYPKGHPLWDWGAYPESDEQMPDHRIADWAIQRLKAEREAPFFLAVGFFRPHVPMYAPQKWFDRHPRSQVQPPETLSSDRSDLSAYAKAMTNPDPAPPHEWLVEHEEWRHAVQAYLASCTFVDRQVGRVLDALRASGEAEDTVIVLFSDHGWHLGEKQRWAKRSLWEDATRVPLIVAAPGYEGGRPSGKPVGLIDIYPTLMDLCGLEAPHRLEGRSLVPLMEDPEAEWNRPILTTYGRGNHAVRSERFRYIRYKDGSEELYDHRDDPHEWHNLADDPDYAEVKERLKQHLPEREHPVLDGDSSGHRSYREAEKILRRQAE